MQLAEKGKSFVDIQGLTASTMEILLDFVYTETVLVTVENVQELLPAACLLQLKGKFRSARCTLIWKMLSLWVKAEGMGRSWKVLKSTELKKGLIGYLVWFTKVLSLAYWRNYQCVLLGDVIHLKLKVLPQWVVDPFFCGVSVSPIRPAANTVTTVNYSSWKLIIKWKISILETQLRMN